jgi:anti-sigma-K factor RskA
LKSLRGHEDYKEMIAAHALGAIDEAEARELETHIEACAECRAELKTWRDTTAALAYAAPSVEPRAALRSQILNRVGAQSSAQSSRSKTADERIKSQAEESSRSEPNVVAFTKPARRVWSMAARVGAIAASLVFVALIISLILLWNRYSTMQQEVARLGGQLNQTQTELRRERETSSREQEALKLMTAPNASMASLKGTEMAENAHAKFVFDRQTGRAMLMADNLPPAPAGKAYQLWFIAGGKPMPGRVFTPDAAGRAEMHDEVPAEARNTSAVFAVTLEPSSGMKEPTGPKYLLSAAS